MDLVVFENNKPWVIDEFREGHFDYVELASDVAETKFFQFLFGQQVVDRLVQHYPSPRDRHHVPLWMYVCSQLTLRLHGQHITSARAQLSQLFLDRSAGGLVDALGPEVARRQVDPESGNLTLECAGFNDRNPLSPPDPLRSGLPPQAGPRHRAGVARGVVQPPRRHRVQGTELNVSRSHRPTRAAFGNEP